MTVYNPSETVTVDTQFITQSFVLNGSLASSTLLDGGRTIGETGTIKSVVMFRGQAGGSGSTICDINKNGTTMYTTQGNRPTILSADGDNKAIIATLPDVTSITAGDFLSVDVDSSESGPAKDLTVVVIIEVTA